MATITLHGNEIHTNGELPAVGSAAPDFTLTDGKLNDVSLDQFSGKKKVLSIVPSLDTPTCAKSTVVFNESLAARDDVVVLVASADLPFAQGRFCEAANTGNVVTLSMMRDRNFAKNYGVLITDGPLSGVTARAVLVIDENNTVTHAELVPEIGDEPNYDAVTAALG